MRRIETYVGQQVYEWAFSSQAQLTMTAIAKVCAALFGTSGTVNGLACGPTSPATMTVQIGAGEIYQIEPLEATTCGTLPANTANTILKQGIQLGTYTTGTFATPGTSGQSINYLIEAQYQDSDISLDPTTGNSPVVLQFYNSTNPATPWSGPNNSGSTSNTFRDGIVAYQIKAGTAATTGSQTTPSPDTGWIGLWVVTVPFGATSLTSSNIAQYTGSPILPTGVLQSILTSNLTYGIDNGSANVVQATFPIPVATLTDGMDVWVKVKAANTGATTFTPNPGVISASPVIGAAHAALQGGELIANGRANLVWRQDVTSWVLVECTGAAIQVAPATQSEHAMQLGQATGRLLNVQTFTASGTYTPIAGTNSIIVEGVGASAGSGGVPATTSAQSSTSGSGGSGTYAKARWTSGFSGGLTVTIGAGGAAGTTAPSGGGAGGNTSLGSLLILPGAPSSGAGGLTTGPAISSGGAGAAAATITGAAETFVSIAGQGGNPGVVLSISPSVFFGGNGGNNPLGFGGVGIVSGGGARAQTGYGAGAPGSGIGPSGAAQAGFVGTQGILIISEYA